MTERFLDASAGGGIEQLIEVLAPDVTLTSDGGGKARAALRQVTGSAKVARLLHGLITRPKAGLDVRELDTALAEINSRPGLVYSRDGQTVAAVAWEVSGGLVTAIQLILNPDKLAAISAGRTLLT